MIKFSNFLAKLLDRVCLFGAHLAAAMLVMLFILGLLEIIMRSAFNISLSIALEYSGYMVALVLLLGSGWTLSVDGHIRVNVITSHLSPPIERALDILMTLIALCVAGFMTYSLFDWAMGTLNSGQVSYYTSKTPLWIPQMALTIGPFFLFCGLLSRLIKRLTNQPLISEGV